MEKKPIIIHIKQKNRNRTSRTMEEDRRCNERIKKNVDLFYVVKKFLLAYYKGKLLSKDMLSLASEIAKSCKVTTIDRDAKRKKDALICWFAENWNTIVSFIVEHKKDDKPESQSIKDYSDITLSYDFDVFNEPDI